MGMCKEVWKAIRLSMEMTSLKGIPRILKTRRKLIKVLWCIFTLAFFVYLVLLVKDTLSDYFSHPTVIDFQEVFPVMSNASDGQSTTSFFPVVALCNLKPVHVKPSTDVFTESDYLRELQANVSALNLDFENLNKTERDAIQYLFRTAGYYEYIGINKSLAYGIQEEDFIRSCSLRSFEGDVAYPCEEALNISLISIPDYFNCFKISVRPDMLDVIQPYRLTLDLYLDDHEKNINPFYSQFFDDQQLSGVKLSLHSHYDMADMTKDTLSLPPGYKSSVKIDIIKRKRLKKPYGDCVVFDQEVLYTRLGHSIPYGRIGCYHACLQEAITNSCRCMDTTNMAFYSEEEALQEFCASPRQSFQERLQSMVCTIRAKVAVSEHCYHNCKAPCLEAQVSTEVTSALWPRLSQQLALYETLIRNSTFVNKFTDYQRISDAYSKTRNETKALEELGKLRGIRANFLKVEIIQPKRHMFLVANRIKTTQSDLIATVGSLSNLYSGITLIVMIEILELIVNLIYIFLEKDRGGEKDKQRTQCNGQTPNGGCHVLESTHI